MKNAFILFLGMFLLVSCQETKKEDTTKPKTEVVNISTDVEIIFQKILDLRKLQAYYHTELAGRIPLKLVQNEFVSDSLNLKKFNKKVSIASLTSFEKSGIKDHLLITALRVENDTAHFSLRYDVEGIFAQGSLIKGTKNWAVHEYAVQENNADISESTQSKHQVRTISYKGADLSYLAKKYYGHGRFSEVLKAYNGFTGKRSTDKKNDSIKIPELSFLTEDPTLRRLHKIKPALDKILAARDVYLKQGRSLRELPRDENREYRPVPQAQKLKLLGASKLMYEAISELESKEKSSKKAIGQFRQVADYFEDIANGKIDENGYILDLVHQRLAYGFGNSIKWAKENGR